MCSQGRPLRQGAAAASCSAGTAGDAASPASSCRFRLREVAATGLPRAASSERHRAAPRSEYSPRLLHCRSRRPRRSDDGQVIVRSDHLPIIRRPLYSMVHAHCCRSILFLLIAVSACSAAGRSRGTARTTARAQPAAHHHRHAARRSRRRLRLPRGADARHRRARGARRALRARLQPAPITLTSHATHHDRPLPARARRPAQRHAHRSGGADARGHARRAPASRPARSSRAFPLDRRFGLIKGFQTYGDRMPRGAAGPSGQRAARTRRSPTRRSPG